MIDRRRVKAAFGRQAKEYDEHASVQKRVVETFLEHLVSQKAVPPKRILDAGCGTGSLLHLLRDRYGDVPAVGVDLAMGMCRRSQYKLGSKVPIVHADVEHLPFTGSSFDLLISTSTYQWLGCLSTAFNEVFRVLEPGGLFFFTLFGDRTLYELKDSYQQALLKCWREEKDRMHRFLPKEDVLLALERAGFADCAATSELEMEFHEDVPALLRSLKRIGAGNASPTSIQGLAQKNVMLEMMKHYRESYGNSSGVPATYEVIYGSGWKV